MAGRQSRWVWHVAVLLAAAGIATGCGGAAPATAPPEPPPAGAQAAPTASATLPSAALPALTPAGEEQAAAESTLPPGLPDVPYDMTGYEMIAASVGEATYSGYSCVIAEAGCACELPLLLAVAFTFTPEGTLIYTFEGDGFKAPWEMTRVAPNQWEYVIAVQSEERNEQIGESRTLLSFTEQGYVLTQLVDLKGQGIIQCPEVNFRRLMDAPEG